MTEYRTEDNPFEADNPSQEHLNRAMEILEQDGEIQKRRLFDASAHIKVASLLQVIEK